MVKVNYDAAESTDRGRGIEQEGQYHFVITAMDPDACKLTGEPLNAWKIEVSVLDGTVRTKDGKSCVYKGVSDSFLLRHPCLGDNDQGDFARKVQTRFLEVTRIIEPSEKGKQVVFDSDDAIGRQFVAHIKKSKKGYWGISGADVWHVDDPTVDHVPKDESYISQIPAVLRWPDSQVKQATAAEQKKAETPYSEQVKQDPTAIQAPVDYDDI